MELDDVSLLVDMPAASRSARSLSVVAPKDISSMNERFEYYWENGRVVEYTNHRNGHRGRFPKAPYDSHRLIAIIQHNSDGNKIVFGPQATPERTIEAMARYSRYFCDPSSKDIGQQVPSEMLQKISSEIGMLAQKVTQQWELAGNEEGLSGCGLLPKT